MLYLTLWSRKSLSHKLSGGLIGGITLVVVPLLALEANRVQKCDSSFSRGVDVDGVSTYLKETIILKKILENYSIRHKHKLFSHSSPQTLDKWKNTIGY